MKIVNIRALRGPNVWLHRPVLVMKLDLEDLTERESNQFEGFVERLLETVPGLATHSCDTGEPGRFVERLHMGTYFGHTVEHVAIELTQMAGVGVTFGKTRSAGPPGLYNVIVAYKSEATTRFLLTVAVELVQAVLNGQLYSLDEKLEAGRRLTAQHDLGPSTGAIVEAAERRGIPVQRLNSESLVQLGYGAHRKHIQAAMSSQSSAIAVEIAGDKDLTKQLLSNAFIPVPESRTVTTALQAVEAWEVLGGAVVVKPLDGRQGRGVSLNLNTAEQVIFAFEEAAQYSDQVLVERFVIGRDYRILVIGGKLVAASERRPALVIGDGLNTIAELVEIENSNPLRGEDHEKALTRMRLDPLALATLAKQGYTPADTPPAGFTVLLRENANLSTGGTATDVTDLAHPSLVEICERATRVIGLDICGIDLVAPDISQPLQGEGGIVELNAAPGLRMHLHPSAGQSRAVGAAIIEMLYPGDAPSRIPIIAVTGTNGKTTTTRMIGHILATAGQGVGMTTTDAIYIRGQQVAEGDMTGPASARTVLGDPSVEVAVLETARGGIMHGGLGYDWSDVGVITNIQADHIGQDGIEDVDDLVWVKSLIAERVREGGTLVLSADDANAASVARRERVRRLSLRTVYFALRPHNPLVREHVSAGGIAYYVRDGWIVEATGPTERRIVRVGDIPATLGGLVEFNVSNALAAVAAVRAQGIVPATILSALSTFDANLHNPGRLNLYRVGQGHLIVDYGHNPHAYAAMCSLAQGLRNGGRRATGVVGLPGDRADSLTQDAARIAAHGFDRIVVREDGYLRGRQPGELAGIIRATIAAEAPQVECIEVLDEAAALDFALRTMQPGEVVMMFYDEMPRVQEVLRAHGALPATDLEAPMPVQVMAPMTVE